jgi:hypothetical protein
LVCSKNERRFFLVETKFIASDVWEQSEKREATRCLVDAFVGCLAGIRRLGKKDRIPENLSENKKFSDLFTTSTNLYRTTSKCINKASSFNPHFQIAPKHHRQ